MLPILYLAPVEWSSIWQRPQQLAVRLNRHFEVHYVDPVGLRSVRLSDLARIRRARRTTSQPGALPSIKPRYLPWLGNRLAERCNRRWLRRQIAAQFDLGRQPWILWIGSPSLLADELLEQTAPALVVYDSMDRYPAFHRGRTRRRIEQAEAKIVSRAHLVFASSHGLAQRWDALKSVTLVPNGVDAAAFHCQRTGRPPDWHRGPATHVIGFHGTLGDWLDYELLIGLAKRHADWRWVFLGPVHSQRAKPLLRLPNVCSPGAVPYTAIAQQAAWFDVGLVPFRLNELTRYVHPIKALEYLALGLPVVSARLPDLSEHADLISFASTLDQWSAQLKAALAPAARQPRLISARRRVARAHDWDHRVASIVARVAEALPPAGRAFPAGQAFPPDIAHDRSAALRNPTDVRLESLTYLVSEGQPC